MQRVQFIEIHEQPWFPAFLRDQVTDALQTGMHFLNAYVSIAPLLEQALMETENKSILDLGSGGGGPWLALSRTLHDGAVGIPIRLTDRQPNLRAFEALTAASENRIAFCGDCIDARKVPRAMGELRTMFSTFHHFPPEEAAAVLQDAVDARESIGIFEITKRTPSAIAAMFPWALLAFVYTPFIRPFRWSRLFWTYIIPLIPLVVLFDGIVSCLRTYDPQELKGIVARVTCADYQWQIGEHSRAGDNMPITYLIGRPKIDRQTRDSIRDSSKDSARTVAPGLFSPSD